MRGNLRADGSDFVSAAALDDSAPLSKVTQEVEILVRVGFRKQNKGVVCSKWG